MVAVEVDVRVVDVLGHPDQGDGFVRSDCGLRLSVTVDVSTDERPVVPASGRSTRTPS